VDNWQLDVSRVFVLFGGIIIVLVLSSMYAKVCLHSSDITTSLHLRPLDDFILSIHPYH